MEKNNYPTPHINAEPSDFGRCVLMPGDPLRSKFIAENYLDGARLINNVRSVQGYTGEYKGVKISVMASGMGMPSMGIYSYELYNFFGVSSIIRVGSAGAIRDNVWVRDIVLGMGACTNSNYAAQFETGGCFSPICDWSLLKSAAENCVKAGARYHVGNIYSSDTFYSASDPKSEKWAEMGALAVEMEAAALYMNAARAGKRALAICTVSDSLVTGESLSSEERENSFTQMIEIALETAVAADRL